MYYNGATSRTVLGLQMDSFVIDLFQYLGEESSSCLLRAAVVCSCPWNLDVSDQILQSYWRGREVYSRAMGSSLKALFKG